MSMSDNLDLLKKRHSVRSFTTDPIDPDIIKSLKSAVTMINTHEAGAHFQIVTDDDAPFKGFSHSYGFFRNPRNYIACVMDMSFPDAMERAGYFAQELVMKCVESGLGTCYVGGTYNASGTDIQIRADWKLLFLILFGYPGGKDRTVARMMMKMAHRHDRTPEQFFTGDEKSLEQAVALYPQLPVGLEALACSPSSLNKQPVRVRFADGDNNSLEICVDPSNPKNLIDLGIAKYNFSFATGIAVDWGNPAIIER